MDFQCPKLIEVNGLEYKVQAWEDCGAMNILYLTDDAHKVWKLFESGKLVKLYRPTVSKQSK